MSELAGIGDFDRDGSNDLIAVEAAIGKLFSYPGHGTWLGSRSPVGTGWAGLRPLLCPGGRGGRGPTEQR